MACSWLFFSEFLADMKERKQGHIVNITSINERVARAGMVVYSGTKAFWAGEGGVELLSLQVRASA